MLFGHDQVKSVKVCPSTHAMSRMLSRKKNGTSHTSHTIMKALFVFAAVCNILPFVCAFSSSFRWQQLRSHSIPKLAMSQQGSTSQLLKRVSLSAITLLSCGQLCFAKPEGVNRPELLPKEFTTVIDVANFLRYVQRQSAYITYTRIVSKGQERSAIEKISALEKSTGFKLRVLCQR